MERIREKKEVIKGCNVAMKKSHTEREKAETTVERRPETSGARGKVKRILASRKTARQKMEEGGAGFPAMQLNHTKRSFYTDKTGTREEAGEDSLGGGS